MSTLLRVEGIEVGYGDLTAVRDVSFEVRDREAVALVGSNGAGKTTTLRAVSGLLPLRRGRIWLAMRRGISTADPGLADGRAQPALPQIESLSADGLQIEDQR